MSFVVRLLYPDVQSLEWLQCQTCDGWLHKDCAGCPQYANESFNCGCTDPNDCTRYHTLVKYLYVVSQIMRQRPRKNEHLADIQSLHSSLRGLIKVNLNTKKILAVFTCFVINGLCVCCLKPCPLAILDSQKHLKLL